MSVGPEGLRCAAGAPDTGPAACSYDVDASFMLFLRHGCGIHAVWSSAGVASVTEARFRRTPRPAARQERTALSGIEFLLMSAATTTMGLVTYGAKVTKVRFHQPGASLGRRQASS